MLNFLLRAKHWQVFLLTFVLPVFGGNIAMMIFILSHPRDIVPFFYIFPFAALLMLLMLSWHFSVAVGLQRFLPAGYKMKVNRFRIFFFVPLIYFLAIGLFLGWVFAAFPHGPGRIINPLPLFGGMMLLLLMHLFSMFCIFYIFFFAAKTLSSAELKREAELSDYILDMLLFWFSFVGIWLIQPRINALMSGRTATPETVPDA